MKALQQLVAARHQSVIEHRRYLHAHPEASFQEGETRDYICRELERLGIAFTAFPDCNSVVGRLRGELPGKVAAFRADIDALRMQEKNDLSYRSQREGVMHACGHDGHTAALLGLAALFAEHPELVRGEVVFLFQHAEEEPPGGASTLVERGVLEGVDAVFGAHIWTPMELGTIGLREGAIMASADKFTLTLTGQGGHGASPQETDDVLLLGAAAVQQLQAIVSRRVDPHIPTVLSVCQFHAGSAFNIIPDQCAISGTVRTCDEGVRRAVPEMIRRVAEGVVSGAPSARCALDYTFGYPAVVNDEHLTALVNRAVREDTVYTPVEVKAAMGADDFAYYGAAVPSVYFFVGAGNVQQGLDQPHHSPTFDFDERALAAVMEVFLASYLRLTGQDIE